MDDDDHPDDNDDGLSSPSRGRRRQQQQQQRQRRIRRRDDGDRNDSRDRNQWTISNVVRILQIFFLRFSRTWRQFQPLPQQNQHQQRKRKNTLFVVPFGLVFLTYICVDSIQRNTMSRLSKYQLQQQHQQQQHPTTTQTRPQTSPSVAHPSSTTVLPSLPPSAPFSFSSSFDCLLEWDRQKTMKHIVRWLEHQVPVLITAIRHRDFVYIIFTQEHFYRSNKRMDYNIEERVEWMCNYRNATNNENGGHVDDDDDDSNNISVEKATATIQRKARFAPHDHRHHNHVILTCETTIQQVNSSGSRSGETETTTSAVLLSTTAHNWTLHSVYPTTRLPLMDDQHHSTTDDATATTIDPISSSPSSSMDDIVYDLTLPLECDQVQEREYEELRTPQMNRHYNHQRQQPPEPTTSQNGNDDEVTNNRQLAACLRFKGEDDRRRIPEWIEYHRIIGIQHFWIFINDPWEVHNGTELTSLYGDKSYVSFVPFNLNWIDYPTQITSKYQYINRNPKWSQEPAQWQCLYMAKKYGYDWVVTTDVDEYIYISPYTTRNNTKNSVVVDDGDDNHDNDATTARRPPLQVYLDRFDTDSYASLVLASIPFGNNTFSNETTPSSGFVDGSSPFYMIDYVWRKNRKLQDYKLKHYKQFYNVRRTHSIGVHFVWKADDGLETNVQLDHSDRRGGVFLHHYKMPHAGVSLNGADKLIKNASMVVSDPTLRDEYRDELDRVLKGLRQNDATHQR